MRQAWHTKLLRTTLINVAKKLPRNAHAQLFLGLLHQRTQQPAMVHSHPVSSSSPSMRQAPMLCCRSAKMPLALEVRVTRRCRDVLPSSLAWQASVAYEKAMEILRLGDEVGSKPRLKLLALAQNHRVQCAVQARMLSLGSRDDGGSCGSGGTGGGPQDWREDARGGAGGAVGTSKTPRGRAAERTAAERANSGERTVTDSTALTPEGAMTGSAAAPAASAPALASTAAVGDRERERLAEEDAETLARELRAAAALDPSQAAIWNNLGLLLAHSSRHKSAVEVFQGLLSAMPDHVDALANLGACYLHLHDIRRAEKCLQAALLRDSSHVGALTTYSALLLAHPPTLSAEGLRKDGQHARAGSATIAQRCLEAALMDNTRSGAIWTNLGAAFVGQGKPAAASRCLEQAALLEPRSLAVRLVVARQRVRDAELCEDPREQLGWAANEMASLLREKSSVPLRVAWAGLALVNRAQSEAAAALDEEDAVKEYEERVLHTLQQERWDEAIAAFDRALASDPSLDAAKSNGMKAAALAKKAREADSGRAESRGGEAEEKPSPASPRPPTAAAKQLQSQHAAKGEALVEANGHAPSLLLHSAAHKGQHGDLAAAPPPLSDSGAAGWQNPFASVSPHHLPLQTSEAHIGAAHCATSGSRNHSTPRLHVPSSQQEPFPLPSVS
eukprot:SM000031S11535  [mRNA]  locus=s31:218473:222259:+ [translate_table: standard]